MRKICVLGEMRADRVVDRARRGQALADRLFHHHARPSADQPGGAEAVADRPEQLGRGGEVEHPHRRRAARPEQPRQFGPARRRRRRRPGCSGAGRGSAPRVGLVRRPSPHDRGAGERRGTPRREGPARHPDDARPLRQLPGGVAVAKGRQQLAPGEVAGGAEDDEVERIDRDHARDHALEPLLWWCSGGLSRPERKGGGGNRDPVQHSVTCTASPPIGSQAMPNRPGPMRKRSKTPISEVIATG